MYKRLYEYPQGGFIDKGQRRVAYERMRDSEVYRDYVELSYSLKDMELDDLKTREEKIAFWINLYNVIVIHGVVEMGIRDSVKEVRNFFRRVRYRIGDMVFTPDEIEHGVLRNNRRPPNTLFRFFNERDKRLGYVVDSIDPRIHFAPVCASSACPPIEVYTDENLGKEFTIAGEAFLNGGGIRIDRGMKHVAMSRIFKWYGGDFGNTQSEILRFIAPYLYDPADREFIEENTEELKVTCQAYDWRLNRY